MSVVRRVRSYGLEVVALAVAFLVFVIPFIFIVMTAAKDRLEASHLDFTLPTAWQLQENFGEVIGTRNDLMVTAMRNSLILTVASVSLIVLLSAMVGIALLYEHDYRG